MAWEAWRRADSALLSVQQELDLAQENLALARANFDAGLASWLEVEVAELTLRTTELAVVSERMQREQAAVRLLAATGAL